MKNATFVVCLLALAPHAFGQERKGLLLGESGGIGNSSPDQCQGCKTGLAIDS